jgi:hypothetical protein
MDFLPLAQKQFQIREQFPTNLCKVAARKFVILSQFYRSLCITQYENSLVSLANHMHMCWSVVVRIYNNTQCANPQNSWHSRMIAQNPSA